MEEELFCTLPLIAYIIGPYLWIKNGGVHFDSSEEQAYFLLYPADDGFMSAARRIDLINDDLQEITDNFNIAFIIAGFFAT